MSCSLARLNPSKFQRLNQRLNQSPTTTSQPSQPSPTIPQSALRPPPPPLPPGTNHIPQHSSSARPSFPSSNAASAERLASIERLFDSLESVTRCFQSVQQPYALLVDLSDSHSFSLALHRSITSRLRSLLEAGQANLPAKHSHGSIGEKAVGISCLASFLGYLSFRHQSSLLPSPSPTLFLTTPTAPHHVSMYANEPLPRSSFISLSPPPSIDLLGLLHSFTSEGCNDVFFLAVHIPCFYSFILPYLSLCSWNQSLTPHQAVTNDHPRIMIQGIKSLMMLRSSPLLAIPLLPEATDSLSFEEFIKDKRGAAIICIRCLLDDLHQRILATFGPKSAFLPASLPPPSPSPFPSLHPPRVPPQHIVKAPETDFSPDISFMELCCPSLAISCRQLEASSARFRSSSSASSSSSAQVITDQGQEESSSHPPAVPPRRVYAHPVHFGSMMQQSLISINIGQSISSSAQQPLPPSYLEMLSSSPSSSSSVAPSTSNGNPVDPIREKLKQLFINQYSTDDTPIKMKDVLSYITENITTNILCHVMKPLPSSLNQAADAFKDMAEGESIVARAIHHGSAVTIPSEAAKALFTMGITLITSSSLQDESTGDKIKSAIVKAARDLASVVFKDALESASRACLSMLRGKQLGHKNGPIAALLPSSVPQSAVAAAASLAEKDILSILATRLWSQIQNQVQKQLISIIQRPEGNVQAVSKALSGLRLESVAEEMMEGRQAQRDDWDLMGPHSSLTDLIFSLASQSKPGQLNNALSNQLSALTCWPECVVYRSEEGRKIALALQAGLQEGRVKGPLEIESVFCWILSLGFEAEKKSLVAWAGAHFFVLCSERTIKDKVHIDAWMGKEDSNLVVMTHLPSKLISYAVETEDIDLISLIRKTLQKLSFNSVGLV